MFSCVWLHFKKRFEKYSLVFGCVLENTIENTFSTCCSHFLTFSRLPNEYIISFIPQYRNTNKTQKKKIKSNQIERRRNRERRSPLRDRDRHFARLQSARRRDRDRREGEIAIGGVLRAISVISADDLSDRSFGRSRRAQLSLWRDRSWAKALYSLFFLSLSLSLFLSLSLSFARDPKIIWR